MALSRVAVSIAAVGLTAIPLLSETQTAQTPSFEVASIRPSNSSQESRSASGGPGTPRPVAGPPRACQGTPVIEHNHFTLSNVTVYTLIALAFGQDCTIAEKSGLLSGGPEWIRSQAFDIAALIPDGTVNYTSQQLQGGNAPKLQSMIQTLLADRFKLTLHHDTRETSVYVLAASKGGAKLEPSKSDSCATIPDANTQPGNTAPRRLPPCGSSSFAGPLKGGNWTFRASGISLDGFAKALGKHFVGRPVIDNTAIAGTFDIQMEFALEDTPVPPGDAPSNPPAGPSIFTAIQEQLGLKLDAAKKLIEVLVVDHAERPTAN